MTHAILHAHPIAPDQRSAGMTLIELMVALAIGMFLMIGAVTVFMQSRATFRVTEAMSRLQENGRFVLDALEADIRMAGFWGLTSRSVEIANRAGPADPNGIGTDACGQNWLIDFNNAVAGTNNGYAWACQAQFNDPNANADTLVVRRVSEDPDTPAGLAANTLYVMSTRGGPQLGEVFAGPAAPAGWLDPVPLPPPPQVFAELHPLVVSGYYVSNQSSPPNGNLPSLRMKVLVPGNAANPEGLVENREVLTGVEDFQIQLGVDTDPPGDNGTGAVDRYVDPDDAILANPDTAVLAVRIWVRIRAETDERGFLDTANYVYADQNVGPFNDAFRRIVVSKTIYLRNARPVGS